jgi:2'-5' RNA ligase
MDRSNDRGRSVVIVAIPEKRDPVWKISSEKVPHLTLCYLGDQVDDVAIIRMTEYLDHVVKTSIRPFGLGVKRRGLLGEHQADVLFFKESHADELRDIRSYLLGDGDIYNAYHSTDQYEKWLPHLTLGYPETPARPEVKDSFGIDWVYFDRVALWTGDYEGAEFELNRDEVSMSDSVNDILEHFGTKGMKWGVRKDKGHEGERAKTSKIEKLDRKFEQRGGTLGTYMDIHNAAAKLTNKNDIDRINNKPQYKGRDFTRDSPLRRKYYREHQKAYLDNVERAAKDMGTNASGTKSYRIVELPGRDGLGLGTWQVEVADVKHADVSDDTHYLVKIRYDDMGHIVSVEEEGDDLEQSDSVEEFLAHFGVKGMKWGVVRDKENVLTEARDRFKDTVKRGVDDHKDKSSVREFRKRAEKSGVRTLGDKELAQLVKRADLENKYRELRQKEKEASRAFVKALWDNFGKEIFGAIIREGVAYKFRGGNNSGGSTKTTVIDGRVLEGASRAIGRFASSK